MRKFFPVEELARDQRFHQITMKDRMADPRSALGTATGERQRSNRLVPSRPDASQAARALMHGIFVGEIQALEGAGRTCHDFRTQGDAARRAQDEAHGADVDDVDDAVPFALKLDMARQAWDEARHVEISVKLSDWMGSEIGEFAENTVLFQAACSTDPILRLAGVNRALEGLAIDVFTTMKEFGGLAGDPFLEFCEDWMLADEVTHVKMGSDWLRKVTEHDPDRRKKALEFQSVVDKLFSYGGTRSDSQESPIGLARRFRELAGFTDTEVEEIAEVSLAALDERKAAVARMQAAAAVEHTLATN
ncbi:MAG: DUF455 family protein [Actinobacteria bacterium]|jgi:uncharacterized ferritin-like protein (DUF455 family)|uniref:Unannotated protein n=1 Tax=freshwater metagenome TaxID=449393 RepID=A0A6J6E7Q3_9ZZZZ|nr:DUF455 family protein [Actinomycetota bacterium]